MPQKRIPERVVGQIDDVPVLQILKEVVEVVKAVKTVPQERFSEGIGEQIDDDIVPVDQPGDQARCDTQACGDAEKGPSDSDELRQIPNPISQNLLMKGLRKWRNAPDTGAADTGAEGKEPETAGERKREREKERLNLDMNISHAGLMRMTMSTNNAATRQGKTSLKATLTGFK